MDDDPDTGNEHREMSFLTMVAISVAIGGALFAVGYVFLNHVLH